MAITEGASIFGYEKASPASDFMGISPNSPKNQLIALIISLTETNLPSYLQALLRVSLDFEETENSFQHFLLEVLLPKVLMAHYFRYGAQL